MVISSQGKQYDLRKLADRKALLKHIISLKKNKKKEALAEIAAQMNALSFTQQALKDYRQAIVQIIPDLMKITNPALFPRSEYCARFEGTTAFVMENPDYWGHYHRGESTRFFDESKGRKNTQFTSPNLLITKPAKANSFFAHTGGVRNPFSSSAGKYKTSLSQTSVAAATEEKSVRDASIRYRRKMAEQVVSTFAALTRNEVKLPTGYRKPTIIRPIVYYEDGYPCVLISSPILSTAEYSDDISKYWAAHPKPMQRLMSACFVAFANVEAKKAGIPIEIVLRSSFGHSLPSVCETNNTFRIHVGIIPKKYAVILGKALHKLNEAFIALKARSDTTQRTQFFSKDFLVSVRKYNARKLKEAIDAKPRYHALKTTPEYKTAETSDDSLKELHRQLKLLGAGKPATGKTNLQLVELKNMSAWRLLCKAGDSLGKSVLSELFRHNKTMDWFVNILMDALLSGDTEAIETALIKLLGCLSYKETVTMDYKKIDSDLKKAKYQFASLSFAKIFAEDADFNEMTNQLFKSFCAKRPSEALYASLDHAGSHFVTTYRGSDELAEEADNGSESEFSVDLSPEEPAPPQTKPHVSHSKLRVCSGMKAIVLAHYAAIYYLKESKFTSYQVDIQQMYYEASDAIKMVKKLGLRELNALKRNAEHIIMYFDLNHCNAANSRGGQSLEKKLESVTAFTVAVLDYTSSTHEEVEAAAAKCLLNAHIKLVIMVSSDLKNNQGGLDLNPYGEVHIMARDRATRKKISAALHAALGEKDKLSPQTHEMVRACKKRGLGFSLSNFFQSKPQNPDADATTPTMQVSGP